MSRRRARPASRAVVALPALAFGASVALAGCGAPPAPAAFSPAPEARTPFRVMADSTIRLATHAADASDTATTQVRLVLVESSPERVPPLLAMVRTSTASASANAGAAIAHGDRLRDVLGAPEDRMAQGYGRYWAVGRRHLDIARVRADQATAATDSAISCGAAPCATLMAREAKTHVDAAAGAAREAESVIRIAASYVN